MKSNRESGRQEVSGADGGGIDVREADKRDWAEVVGETNDAATLRGQAAAAVAVARPVQGDTVVLQAMPGTSYALEFAPGDTRFLVEGDNVVMSFDTDGDGIDDARIVFLDLAGMAGEADAPHLVIAGVNYDVSVLVDTAQNIFQAQGLEAGKAPDQPAGPAVETAGGDGGSPQPTSGGGSSYQDDFGSTPFSSATQALSGVSGPLSATFAQADAAGGTVTAGLPRLVAAGGPGGGRPGGGSEGDPGPGGVETLSGQVVDGYVANATVFRDANNNGELDDGEVSTTTDIDGNFVLAGGSGPLIAIGGTDVSTGLAFEGVLKAPEGSTVITPLTTLVQQLVESGETAAVAEAKVKQALGIDAGFNLQSTDPVKAAAAGDAAALKAVKAGIAVANTATQVKAALTGAGAATASTASNAAFKALADKINSNVNSNTATDLTDSNQVIDVLNDAATNGGTTFNNNDVANATKVIAASNTAVNNVDTSGGGSATDALTNLAQVAQVAQSGASQAIQNAVQNDDDNDVANYDDATEVETEADNAEVGDVDGSSAYTEAADSIVGTAGGDAIDALGGNDTIHGLGGADALSGGAGNDLIYGDAGNDVLSGGAGNDTLFGGDGNDDIIGNAGSDVIDGGAGTDIVRFEGNAAAYSFQIDNGVVRVTHLASGAVDTLTNVESLRFNDGKTLTLTSGTLDISKLGSVSVTFASLDGITEIKTAASQSITLDGGQIHTISEADETLTISGGAAVNIVNAGLVVPNDGTAPTVANLLALEFDGLDSGQGLIPENLTVDGSHTDAFIAFWIPLDQAYVGSGDYYDLAINTSFVYLGNDYAAYLAAGGEPLLDLVKVSGGRLQTLHDNLLGNLGDGPIQSRFLNLGQDDPRTGAGGAFGDRPYHDGSVDSDGHYDNLELAASVVAWDIAHGIAYPDSLPPLYAELAGANSFIGTSANELFFGGAGNDTIDGGDGDDGASFNGSRFGFTVSGAADGTVTVTDSDGNQGSDTLVDVETLYFTDGTLRFGAVLAHAAAENDGGGTDGFHPGSGLGDGNFVIHDNTELGIEAAIKATARYHADLESDGETYYAQLGFSDRDGDGLSDENSDVGFWNFNYSVVDYGDADLSGYDIAITADFTDYYGNVTEGVMVYDPKAHDAAVGEAYYNDPTGGTDGTQNSQNPSWNSLEYNATVPGTYTVILTVTDKETGQVVAQTQMQVVVKADITVGENGILTIQDAIDAAQDGDTIYVPAGTYSETVVIDKLVKLYGAFGDVDGDDAARGSGETVIAGGIYLQDGADGTTIDGFTIQDGAVISGSKAGIYLQDAEDVTIENNVFVRSGEFDAFRAILTTAGGDNEELLVSDNLFSGWATGLYLNPGAGGAEISGNVFDGNNVGLSVDGPEGVLVADNSFIASVFEHLGIGPGATDPTIAFAGNNFDDSVPAVGIYDDTVIVTGDLGADTASIQIADGIGEIAVLGDADFTIIGNDGDNILIGNAGDNVVIGGEGSDSLTGYSGSDTLLGGEGDDFLVGDGLDTSATVALYSTDFSEFELGAIEDGENGWTFHGGGRDHEIVDLGGEHGKVFRISSDPTSGDFAGPYSVPVQLNGEDASAGEPQTTADFNNLVLTFDFKAVSDGPNSSRMEVDIAGMGETDRQNFLVLEWDDNVGLRIAVNEPVGDTEEWANDDFTAFTGNRTLVEGLDLDSGSVWHSLTMELAYYDGADNDAINIYLDGELIGTTTTFENYRDWLLDDHAANAEANQAAGLIFRAGAGGVEGDGDGGVNQGFYFDNIEIAATNAADDSLVGGAGDDTLLGGLGDDVLFGSNGDDLLAGGAGADTLSGGDGADIFIYADSVDGGDVIDGFDGDAGDRIDLRDLLDSLGIAEADRAASVDVQQSGSTAVVSVDSDPGADGFELVVATVTNVTGDLTDAHLELGIV